VVPKLKLSNKNSLGSLSSYRSNTRYEEKRSDEDDEYLNDDEFEDPSANTQSTKILRR